MSARTTLFSQTAGSHSRTRTRSAVFDDSPSGSKSPGPKTFERGKSCRGFAPPANEDGRVQSMITKIQTSRHVSPASQYEGDRTPISRSFTVYDPIPNHVSTAATSCTRISVSPNGRSPVGHFSSQMSRRIQGLLNASHLANPQESKYYLTDPKAQRRKAPTSPAELANAQGIADEVVSLFRKAETKCHELSFVVILEFVALPGRLGIKADASYMNAMASRLTDLLLDEAQQNLMTLDTIAGLFWACATQDYHDGNLLFFLEDQVFKILPQEDDASSGQLCGSIFCSCGILNREGVRFLNKLSSSIVAAAETLPPELCARVIWSAGRLQYCNENLCRSMSTIVAAHLPELDSKRTSEVYWALGELKYQVKELCPERDSEVETVVASKIANYNLSEMAEFLIGMGNLKFTSQNILRSAYSRIIECEPDFRVCEVNVLLKVFKVMTLFDEEASGALFDCVLPVLYKRLVGMTMFDVVQLYDTLDKSDLVHTMFTPEVAPKLLADELFRFWGAEAVELHTIGTSINGRIVTYSEASIAFLYSCSNLLWKPPTAVVEAIVNNTTSSLYKTSPIDAAKLLISCIRLEVSPSSFNAKDICARMIDSSIFENEELATFVYASLANIDMSETVLTEAAEDDDDPSPTSKQLVGFIKKSVGIWSPSGLCRYLWACAMLDWPEGFVDECFRTLEDHLDTYRLHDPSQISTLLWAIGKLKLPRVQKLCNRLVDLGLQNLNAMTPYEVARILWASSRLGLQLDVVLSKVVDECEKSISDIKAMYKDLTVASYNRI
eukprot:GHVO01017312.1.p1 GENE.GHVO01017312.1~~GHVO01017312.1.p1  ORF type:complete len:819 (+),score=76.73 GHVO01017312.1:109-2457(+)